MKKYIHISLTALAFYLIPSVNFAQTLAPETAIATNANEVLTLYPNPFDGSATIVINDASKLNAAKLRVCDISGTEVMNTSVTNQTTTLKIHNIHSVTYFFELINNCEIIQSGKLDAE